MSDVTRLLDAATGDAAAASELLPLVYDELRKLAAVRLADEKPGQTLQPTALVREAYVPFVGPDEGRKWDGGGPFFAAAAESMRRIPVEAARRKGSAKRGGRVRRELDDGDAAIGPGDPDQLLALDEAPTKLATSEPELAKLVELRFFIGLGVEEAAKALGVSPRTVKRDWSYAWARLRGRWTGPEAVSRFFSNAWPRPRADYALPNGRAALGRGGHPPEPDSPVADVRRRALSPSLESIP